MRQATHQELADRLRAAYSSGAVLPLRDGLEPGDAAGAYAVQAINTRFWESQGRRIVGRKAGLTAKAVQQQLGVDQPDFGVLFDDMRVADGGRLDPARCLQAKAEAEIAFVLGADLPLPETTVDAAAAAIAMVHAAIEIVDSRIENWNIKFVDTVADNASSGLFVLGGRPLKLGDFDIANCAMRMKRGDEVVSSGSGRACLGSPLNAAVWLADVMAQRGRPLLAGDIVLTGALGPMVIARPGERFDVDIEGLGSVSALFA